ncbi:MotA/TolQ/ExbB proton channel family protein [Rhodovulum sp. 12E13]|uniref:MotA/TolQ/ExbB proton channel family protein n=1 Tax=Rhodovulum sp. 12E13 TaxID=2203891 RepID=UPI000E174DBB|nr:MotA/TolQ/ExbB proton channel family protein [Rhodovulum sp. 12E13]RDC74050.1 MotA/TolQ/ExbB proton channel family protein [Rhodovulum sp. 12E13]
MGGLGEIGAGGPVLAVLAALSVLSLALIVAKALQLAPVRGGAEERAAALRAWAEGRQGEALGLLRSGRAPADRVMLYTMERLAEGRRGPALVTATVARGAEELARMSSWLRLLELIAMIAPLLGLLGTVLGMIRAFRELELAQGAANASILAGGIWEALLTTAAGLLVAIPAAVGAALLAARAEAGAQAIEASVSELMLVEDAQRSA